MATLWYRYGVEQEWATYGPTIMRLTSAQRIANWLQENGAEVKIVRV